MASSQRDGPQRWLRLIGVLEIAGMVAFTAVVGFLAALRPEYGHLTHTISTLGEIGAPFAIVQQLNFIVLGGLTTAFAYGLHRGMPPGFVLGPLLVALFGLGIVGAGLFPCLPCTDFSSYTWENTTHGITAGVAFVAIMPAPFFLSRRMRSDERWANYTRPFLVLGVLIVAFNVAYYVATGTAVVGALQRALVGAIFVSFGLLAVRLYHVSGG